MIRKLLRFIRGYTKEAVGAPLLVALEVVCALILPRLMSSIIDVGINGDGGFPHILPSPQALGGRQVKPLGFGIDKGLQICAVVA